MTRPLATHRAAPRQAMLGAAGGRLGRRVRSARGRFRRRRVSLQSGLNELVIAGAVGEARTMGCFVNFGAAWRTVTPLGRMGTPDEVAHTVLYLASAMSSFTTGVGLLIDGGRVAT